MPPARLRVLSYNIHKGLSALNRKHVLRDIRDAIRSVEPDIVFLQEVLGALHPKRSRRFDDWPTESQFEYLADSLWHHAYGKNAVYDAGHHGNAVLSKYPVISWNNFDISANRFDRRGILHVTLDGPKQWGVIHGLCVHLGLTERFRQTQVRKLLELASLTVPKNAPLLIAGDFNDWSVRATNRLTSALGVEEVFHLLHGKHAKTFPARLPILKLDRIYSRGAGVENASVLFGKPWCRLSDHAALYAEFSVPLR